MASAPKSLLLTALLCAGAASAQPGADEGVPKAAVVLLGEGALNAKEVALMLNSATDEMKASSGYLLDAVRSLQAGDEAAALGCALDYDCLLRVAESTEVDAVLAVRAAPEGRKSLQLELLWVAADARGLPGESQNRIARAPRELEAAVRAGVKKVIPDYARKGRGGLTVLAEKGAQILIDGEPSGTAPLQRPVILSAGVHRIDVVTQGGTRVSKTVEVKEARRQVADLPSPTEAVASLTAPEQRQQRGGALRTASWVVGGAGALALVGGLYFGLQAQGLNQELASGACSDTPCTSGITQRRAHELYDSANGHATLGNIGVTTGALMLAGAGVMYWLSHAGPSEAPPAPGSEP